MADPLTTGSDAELNLRWVTDPPIREITDPDEVWAAIQQLRGAVEDWYKGTDVTIRAVPQKNDVDWNDWQSPPRTQQERWLQRMKSTLFMTGRPFDGQVCFAYYVNGVPIGLLAMTDYYYRAKVEDLVAHPGSELAGGILIERAVQASDTWGRKGKLALLAMDGDAREAYRRLGFEGKTGPTDLNMSLDPAGKGEIWAKVDTRWRLKKHDGLKYIG